MRPTTVRMAFMADRPEEPMKVAGRKGRPKRAAKRWKESDDRVVVMNSEPMNLGDKWEGKTRRTVLVG